MFKITRSLNIELELDSQNKVLQPSEHKLAIIDESNCIGCTKCVKTCPTNAIIGAIQNVHTVIASLCTGCNLCAILCPTQCIALKPIKMNITDENKTNHQECS